MHKVLTSAMNLAMPDKSCIILDALSANPCPDPGHAW